MAANDNTAVSINGSTVATLSKGQVHEQIIDGQSRITSTGPVLVTQFSNGSDFDQVTSDPFMVIVPPAEQYLAAYTFATPATGFDPNFVNVVTPTSAIPGLTLDGAPVSAAAFSAIGSSGFSGAQLPLTAGTHRMVGTQPFGITVYGFADYDSYGYPGGLNLAKVAEATSLTLTPPTQSRAVGEQACVQATLLDNTSTGILGARIDFTVTGTNPTSGFAFTDSAGSAQFCYSGASAGGDTVQAAAGALSATASVTWSSGTTPPKPTSTTYGGATTVQYSDPLAVSGTLLNIDASPPTPIAGQQLAFALGSQSTSGATNASGVASGSITVNQLPGAYSVSSAFAGTTEYSASSDNDAAQVTKEDCTLALTAPLTVQVGSPVNVSAVLDELDATKGDRSGKSVVFTFIDGASVAATSTGVTAANGTATAAPLLAPGAYSVTANFAGDGYYQSCASDTAVTTVEATVATGAKVTGGGWITDGARTSFGFNVQTLNGVTSGQLQVRAGKSRFHGPVVTALAVTKPTAIWSGTGRWNGVDGYTFTVTVTDGGTKKSGTSDAITLTIKDSSAVIVYTATGSLKGGNIRIH
jgi:hypothetical protein